MARNFLALSSSPTVASTFIAIKNKGWSQSNIYRFTPNAVEQYLSGRLKVKQYKSNYKKNSNHFDKRRSLSFVYTRKRSLNILNGQFSISFYVVNSIRSPIYRRMWCCVHKWAHAHGFMCIVQYSWLIIALYGNSKMIDIR